MLMLTLATALFAVAPAFGQSDPAKANPVDPAAIQALKDMGAYLQKLKRFRVSTDLTGERVLADGQKLQHAASATMDVQRPDMIRVSTETARAHRVLTYDGKTVTLYTPAQKYYSSVPFSGSLDALTEALEKRFGVQIPLQDLFLWGTPAAPVDKIESAMNAGQDIVDEVVCDHYAFRQGSIDWQIWIQAGDQPLPRRLVITNRADEARPQSTSTIDWNLKPGFKNSVFAFVAPQGARKIELVPVKTK
jgi:hypothetical protein